MATPLSNRAPGFWQEASPHTIVWSETEPHDCPAGFTSASGLSSKSTTHESDLEEHISNAEGLALAAQMTTANRRKLAYPNRMGRESQSQSAFRGNEGLTERVNFLVNRSLICQRSGDFLP